MEDESERTVSEDEDVSESHHDTRGVDMPAICRNRRLGIELELTGPNVVADRCVGVSGGGGGGGHGGGSPALRERVVDVRAVRLLESRLEVGEVRLVDVREAREGVLALLCRPSGLF